MTGATAAVVACLTRVRVRASLASVVVSGVASGAMVTPAAADPGFAWQAPSACPDAGDVRARIERRLGRTLDDVAVGISVDIAAEPTGYVARVDARAVTVGNDVRTLTSARCDDLADAVAVIVARLATESRNRAEQAALRFQRTTMPLGAPAGAGCSNAERCDGSIEPRPWGGGVRALALSGVGGVPAVGVGGELAGFLRHRDYFAEIGAARWAMNGVALTGGALAHADVGLEYALVRLGWSPEQMPIRAWLGGELGDMHGDGIAVYDNVAAPLLHAPLAPLPGGDGGGSGRWLAVATGFGVAWPISPWIRLVGTFEVGVPVDAPRFSLAGGSALYEPAPLTARASLGFEVGRR